MPRCEICGNQAMKTCHHIMTRGARGKKALVESNEIWLCVIHHSECHTIGKRTFASKHGLEDRFEKAERMLDAN